MAHTHEVYDTEIHFEINGSNKFIKELSSTKLVLAKGDHNSKVVKFKMPRYICGHDMLLCNRVRVHYINVEKDTNEKSKDIYKVTDLSLCEDTEDTLAFTWTIEAPATKYNGTLAFAIKFECVEDGNILYQWNTAMYSGVSVLEGIDNSEEFIGKYSNVLEEWYNEFEQQTTDLTNRVEALENKGTGSGATKEQLAQIEKNKQDIGKLSSQISNIGGLVEPMDDDLPKVFIDGVIPTTKDDVLAEMTYISKTEQFHAYLKIKCQGSSSMNYDKKNFTIKMYSDEARETKLKKAFKDWKFEQNKYVLKANYIDHSHARNIVSARLWGEVVASRSDYDSLPTEFKTSPNNGAIDGFPVKIYTNGTYQGIYTWNIGKDDWLWGMDEDNPNHVLMCGETNSEKTKNETPCNFRALWSGTNEHHWSIEVGTNSNDVKNSLNALIACVKDTDNETFMATIGNHLDLQSAIDYYIHAYVICGLDGLGKNMLLGTYDLQKWIMGAYDMDSTFGLFWNGNAFVPYSYACPEEYQEPYSLLFERIEKLYVAELKERYAELRKTVYSFSNMFTHFERFMDTIGKDLFEEDLIPYPNIPSSGTNNIKQIRDFIRDRLSYCDTEFSNMDVHVPSTGITLDKTTIEFTDSTPITLVATVEPSNTTEKVVWYSSDSSIASVTDGIVTPVSKGSCVITANCGEVSASCDVNVTVSLTNILSDISWTDGYYLDWQGNPVQDVGNKYSSMIDISDYSGQILQTNLWFSNDSRHVDYNNEQEYIAAPNFSIPLTLPSSAKYMKLSLSQRDMDKVGNEFFLFKVENNLFTSDKVRDGGYTEAGAYDSTLTDYCNISVEVTEGQQYMLHGLTSVFFFDDDGKVLDKITDTTISFKLLTVPENAKTMVAVAKDSYLSNKTPCVSTQYTIVGHTEVEF